MNLLPERKNSRSVLIVGFVLLFASVIGLIRMRIAGRAEPEFWSTAFGALCDATVGRLIDTSPVYKRKPIDQLAFWSPRIERLLEDNFLDAELHAAAALIYDKPSDGMNDLVLAELTKSRPKLWEIENQLFEILRRSVRPYDQDATPLALKLAKRAAELDKDNPQWPRLRLAISSRPLLYPQDAVDRSTDLNELVQRAGKVDPTNGIYELLLAAKRMENAIKFNAELSKVDFEFADRLAAKRAAKLALEAIRKPILEIGEPGFRGLTRIHEMAGHPKRGTMESINSRGTCLRLKMQLLVFVRSLWRAGLITESEGDTATAIEFFSACNLTCKAIQERGGEANFPLTEFLMIRELALNDTIRVQKLASVNEVAKELTDVLDESRALKSAIAAKPPMQRGRSTPWFATVSVNLAEGLLLGLLLCLPLLVLLKLIVRHSSHSRFPVLPWFIGAISLLMTAFFLGAGPAGQISTNTQDWAALGLMVLVAIVFLIGCAIRIKKRPQFRLKSLLLACLIAAMSIQILRSVEMGLPPNLHAESDPGLAAVASLGQSASDWIPGPKQFGSALMQWFALDGAGATVCCTLAVLALLGFVLGRFRETVHQAFVSASLLTLLCFTVWVWVYPSLLPWTKHRNDLVRQFLSEPKEFYAELRAEYSQQLDALKLQRVELRQSFQSSQK